jgi:two-component system, chemotaxis family, sensor kinase CheA
MDLSRYAALFATESREQLAACVQSLLDWERNPGAAEPVLVLFRAMHSFKGMAAAMGYSNLTELAHRSETLLGQLREAPASGRELIDLFLRVVDALERGAPQANEGGDSRLDYSTLLHELDEASEARSGAKQSPVPTPTERSEAGDGSVGREVQVTIRPGAAMRGARAVLALRKAESLGRVTAVQPPIGILEQDGFDGKFSFQLASPLDDAAVAAALVTVGEVAAVGFGEPQAERAGEIGGRARQIRIDVRRLDTIMNLVGELVVAKGRLGTLADRGDPELQAVTTRMSRIANDLYGEVMQVRLTPVWQVFDRFPRVVRDLARQLGRRVRFEVEGEDTQLDRAILDEVGEPLLHILRNAVDHGIEPPSDRRRARKPEEGVIRLSAAGDRTTVVIRVSDDGAGIDRQRVLARAIRDALVPAGTTELADDMLLRVLSRPGFSTAKRVTDVSGRGMGMDAAMSRLRVLGGSIELASTAGEGSVFTLRLPMTLAIIRALLARVGDEQYAIPLSGIAETVEFRPDRLASLNGNEALILREELVPTVRLRERLGVEGPRPPGRQPAVILEVGDRRAALVVDMLMGQQEIVVEPFDAPKGTLPVFSGATILGDGAPALIVDPAALV